MPNEQKIATRNGSIPDDSLGKGAENCCRGTLRKRLGKRGGTLGKQEKALSGFSWNTVKSKPGNGGGERLSAWRVAIKEEGQTLKKTHPRKGGKVKKKTQELEGMLGGKGCSPNPAFLSSRPVQA